MVEVMGTLARVHPRAEGGWTLTQAEGLDGVLALSSVGVEIALSEVFEGVAFEG